MFERYGCKNYRCNTAGIILRYAVYCATINNQPHRVILPPTNQRDIVLDIADNLKQISKWTLKGFHKEQRNIELFLKLTRKDLDELIRFPLPVAFTPKFKKFCRAYNKLEDEYRSGIVDHRVWANWMQTCAQDLTQHSLLV